MQTPHRPLALLFVCLALGCGTATTTQRQVITTPVAASAAPAPIPVEVASEPAPWQSVPKPDAHYLATLDVPTTHDDSVREEHLLHARRHAAQTLQALRDVELAPAHFDRAALLAESKRRQLLGVSFECGVTRHAVDARGTHFSVNVTVLDLRTEDIVATLEGSATAPGPTSPEAEEDALEGALEGALRGVPQLLASLEPQLVAER